MAAGFLPAHTKSRDEIINLIELINFAAVRLAAGGDGVPGGDTITVRELAGMRSGLFNYTETEEFLAKHHCDRHYDIRDLEEDRRNLDQILGPA